jgi:hypothetical protein
MESQVQPLTPFLMNAAGKTAETPQPPEQPFNEVLLSQNAPNKKCVDETVSLNLLSIFLPLLGLNAFNSPSLFVLLEELETRKRIFRFRQGNKRTQIYSLLHPRCGKGMIPFRLISFLFLQEKLP